MRFILIDAKNRKSWDLNVPGDLTHDRFADMLRCDVAIRNELAPGLDLWVAGEPKVGGFRLFSDGPEFSGSGIIVGRTLLDDIKGLPRWISLEMVEKWLVWPTQYEPQPRRRIMERPIRVYPIGPSNPYHRIAPEGALDSSYIMQMYG